ncbi:MAG: hypothetical protein ACTSXH_00135 [Promethearchaeota archaeon]
MKKGPLFWEQLKNTDFYSFFNLNEITQENAPNGRIIKHVKPGGFQEYINLRFWIKEGIIIKAELELDRAWIGNGSHFNLFANDITKSFLGALLPDELQEFKIILIQNIWNLRGTEDIIICLDEVLRNWEDAHPKIKNFIDVYRGMKENNEETFENLTLTMMNQVNEKDGKNLFFTTIKWHL